MLDTRFGWPRAGTQAAERVVFECCLILAFINFAHASAKAVVVHHLFRLDHIVRAQAFYPYLLLERIAPGPDLLAFLRLLRHLQPCGLAHVPVLIFHGGVEKRVFLNVVVADHHTAPFPVVVQVSLGQERHVGREGFALQPVVLPVFNFASPGVVHQFLDLEQSVGPCRVYMARQHLVHAAQTIEPRFSDHGCR
ncbi:hypothetical protein D3C80_998280 [compost metagenome]